MWTLIVRREDRVAVKPLASFNWDSCDGAHLKSYLFGSAEAPPRQRVVLVCGAFLPALVYAPFATALAKQLGDDWGIYVYDRRGKGQSSPVDEDYSLDTEIYDVAAALRSSQAHHLVGHSLGGAIVLHAVRMLCETPDVSLRDLTPETTTVYDPAINVDGSFDTSWLPKFKNYFENGRLGRAMALVERHLGMSRTLSRAPTWMLAGVLALSMRTGLRNTTRSIFPAGVAELTAAFQEEAKASDFANLPARTCLITGERSADYFQVTAATLAKSVPDSRFIVSPKGFHGSIPAVRHRIVESLALWLKDEPLGALDLGMQSLPNGAVQKRR